MSEVWKTAEKMRAKNSEPTRRFLGPQRFERLTQREREENRKFNNRLQWNSKFWVSPPTCRIGSSWEGLEEAVWRLNKSEWKGGKTTKMVVLKFLESLAIKSAISVLKDLEGSITNTQALADLQSAVAFLEKLLGEKVSAT